MPKALAKPRSSPSGTRANRAADVARAARRPGHVDAERLGLIVASKPLTITAADAAAGSRARFSGVVYSGGPLRTWFGDVYLDLEGMVAQLPGASLFNHGWVMPGEQAELGVVESVRVTALGVEVGGYFLDNETGRRVASTGAQGYPWEMSIHAEADDFSVIEQVGPGATAIVNGRTVHGPCEVYRRWRLRESTVCHLGLDPDTALSIAAARQRLQQATGATPMHAGSSSQRGKVRASESETAAAEMVSPDEITIEWLREHKPELVTEIESAEAEPPKNDADKETPDMNTEAAKPKTPEQTAVASGSSPATISQLRALKGSTAEFREECIEAGLTLEAAAVMLTERLAAQIEEKDKQIARHAREAQLKAAAGGVPPVRTHAGADADTGAAPGAGGKSVFAGAIGDSPEEDWAASEELRNYWKGLVTKANRRATDDDARRAFIKSARHTAARGEPWTIRH